MILTVSFSKLYLLACNLEGDFCCCVTLVVLPNATAVFPSDLVTGDRAGDDPEGGVPPGVVAAVLLSCMLSTCFSGCCCGSGCFCFIAV